MESQLFFDSKLDFKGAGDITIFHRDGKTDFIPLREVPFKNAVVNGGRAAQVRGLSNQFGGVYEEWVYQMTFGSGGTVGGVPRVVEAGRTGLWGPVVATKSVISTINPSILTQVTFTSVLLFDDAVGSVVNEMGLVLKNGIYYSITTFGDLSKTSGQQWVINWRISFL